MSFLRCFIAELEHIRVHVRYGSKADGRVPPRNGEGDRARRAWWRGLSTGTALRSRPSTMLRMVPLPVPGRNWVRHCYAGEARGRQRRGEAASSISRAGRGPARCRPDRA
ncbi:hypothetical protein CKY28_08235 [Sphingomonas lenta]|uniref:Uncharacterized protein n=1 Tax=Sphingomonas lenta TaxID=1141887 RepID=A0A2A2SEF9_9SPHN|nr:hypothetical protein CKY28_08235 [Sphingomonas lenta]